MDPTIEIKPDENSVNCLSCKTKLNVGDKPKIRNLVTCHGCKNTFEIIALDPIVLDWKYCHYDDRDSY